MIAPNFNLLQQISIGIAHHVRFRSKDRNAKIFLLAGGHDKGYPCQNKISKLHSKSKDNPM